MKDLNRIEEDLLEVLPDEIRAEYEELIRERQRLEKENEKL